MPGITLGRRLQEAQDAAIRTSAQSLEREADAAGPEARNAYYAVDEFFRHAQSLFEDIILEKSSTYPLRLSRAEHEDAYAALNVAGWEQSAAIKDETHHYFPLWATFCLWCKEQELTPVWSPVHKAGAEPRWQLDVVPAVR